MHTARRDNRDDFLGTCTYLASKVACILPDKDPKSQRFKQNGNFKGRKIGKRRVAADGTNPSNRNAFNGRKENGVAISY